MTDLRERLGAARLEGETARHRHRYDRPPTQAAIEAGDVEYACRCGKRKDPAATRKGRSSTRLGKDQERRIERVYGPTKVGEFGDAIDLLGRDFKWQSKATRAPLPNWAATRPDWGLIDARGWFVRPMEAMAGLHDELFPLLIRTWVRVGGDGGSRTTDLVIVRLDDWCTLHDGPLPSVIDSDYVAMTGEHFLDVHGRDER